MFHKLLIQYRFLIIYLKNILFFKTNLKICLEAIKQFSILKDKKKGKHVCHHYWFSILKNIK